MSENGEKTATAVRWMKYPGCGFDESTNFLAYPTLMPLPQHLTSPNRARLEAELQHQETAEKQPAEPEIGQMEEFDRLAEELQRHENEKRQNKNEENQQAEPTRQAEAEKRAWHRNRLLAVVGTIVVVVALVVWFIGSSAPVQQEPEGEVEIPETLETVEAELLTLDLYDLTLSEGESYILTVTVSPAELEGDFTWSSDDESVATVKQNGLVTYVGEGQCTVTVSAGGLTAQCVVRCNAPAEEEAEQTEEETITTGEAETETETTGSIVMEYTDITLSHIGIGYTCKPTGGNGTYTWSSADTSIATVSSSGYIVGVSKGNTTVTCTSGSETLTIIVRVAPN